MCFKIKQFPSLSVVLNLFWVTCPFENLHKAMRSLFRKWTQVMHSFSYNFRVFTDPWKSSKEIIIYANVFPVCSSNWMNEWRNEQKIRKQHADGGMTGGEQDRQMQPPLGTRILANGSCSLQRSRLSGPVWSVRASHVSCRELKLTSLSFIYCSHPDPLSDHLSKMCHTLYCLPQSALNTAQQNLFWVTRGQQCEYKFRHRK